MFNYGRQVLTCGARLLLSPLGFRFDSGNLAPGSIFAGKTKPGGNSGRLYVTEIAKLLLMSSQKSPGDWRNVSSGLHIASIEIMPWIPWMSLASISAPSSAKKKTLKTI